MLTDHAFSKGEAQKKSTFVKQCEAKLSTEADQIDEQKRKRKSRGHSHRTHLTAASPNSTTKPIYYIVADKGRITPRQRLQEGIATHMAMLNGSTKCQNKGITLEAGFQPTPSTR